jgi:hypothetical protein
MREYHIYRQTKHARGKRIERLFGDPPPSSTRHRDGNAGISRIFYTQDDKQVISAIEPVIVMTQTPRWVPLTLWKQWFDRMTEQEYADAAISVGNAANELTRDADESSLGGLRNLLHERVRSIKSQVIGSSGVIHLPVDALAGSGLSKAPAVAVAEGVYPDRIEYDKANPKAFQFFIRGKNLAKAKLFELSTGGEIATKPDAIGLAFELTPDKDKPAVALVVKGENNETLNAFQINFMAIDTAAPQLPANRVGVKREFEGDKIKSESFDSTDPKLLEELLKRQQETSTAPSNTADVNINVQAEDHSKKH